MICAGVPCSGGRGGAEGRQNSAHRGQGQISVPPEGEKLTSLGFFWPYFHELPPTGDLELLGACLERYWQQKKRMAPSCEPLAVGRMMGALRPYVHGQCLAGAGGGGFLYVLTKAPQQKEALHQILAKTEVRKDFPAPKC